MTRTRRQVVPGPADDTRALSVAKGAVIRSLGTDEVLGRRSTASAMASYARRAWRVGRYGGAVRWTDTIDAEKLARTWRGEFPERQPFTMAQTEGAIIDALDALDAAAAKKNVDPNLCVLRGEDDG